MLHKRKAARLSPTVSFTTCRAGIPLSQIGHLARQVSGELHTRRTFGEMQSKPFVTWRFACGRRFSSTHLPIVDLREQQREYVWAAHVYGYRRGASFCSHERLRYIVRPDWHGMKAMFSISTLKKQTSTIPGAMVQLPISIPRSPIHICH